MYDWIPVKKDLKKYGARNGLLTALMPTASTGQINGNVECFEPFTQNIYTRNTVAGEYYVVNKYMVEHLQELGIWNKKTFNQIKIDKGSVKNLDIPDSVKQIYLTAWEIPNKELIEMCRDRSYFVDQSQSFNLFMDKPNYSKIWSCWYHAWEEGLKTGMYYLRTPPGSEASQFGIDIEETIKMKSNFCEYKPGMAPADCMMCSA